MKKATGKKMVAEKATGEKYKSKSAMAKHEKKEGKGEQKKEKFDFMKMIANKKKMK